MLVLLSLTLSSTAQAQQERLHAPGASISAEDGAAAPWVNPANLAFDPDPSLGLWYRQRLSTGEAEFNVSTTAGPTGLGLNYKLDPTGAGWWGFNTAVGLRLPSQFRLGTNVTWNLPAGPGNNFVSWDLGLGYRPLPWLGFAAVARNIGNPGPTYGVWARYGFSATVRPFQDYLELSVDYEAIDPTAESTLGVDGLQTVAGIVRVRPVDGVVLRARADSNTKFSRYGVGAGVEVYFGGLGGGAYVDENFDAAQVYVISGDDDQRLFGTGKRVPVVDFDQGFAYQPAGSLLGPAAGESYLHLLERLKYAATDKSVGGLLLDLSRVRLSWAQVEELRGVIQLVRGEGKPVVAYLGGSPSNGAFYLATACDQLVLHPAGQLDLVGLSMELQFFRGALDLVGVEPQFAKRSDYKSAPEQFMNTEASENSREQMNALLDDLFIQMVGGIADGRSLDREAVVQLIDEGPFTASEALEAGLIDHVIFPDQLEETLTGLFPENFDLEDDYRLYTETSGWKTSRQIAVIYIEGAITSGESAAGGFLSSSSTGSDTIVRYLYQAAEDSSVKAVVLRVDSPGGSAFASDEIWRAIELLKSEGKPVVVSMGGVAASGGYYVAAGADLIYAEPTTITGSIGVYSGKYAIEELYDKVGINYEIFQRGRKASMYSMSKPMDAVELATMDRLVGETYTMFKSRVAEGRGMSMEQVETVAQGRVWSGIDAKEAGLVDELGGIQEAIDRAKLAAGLDADTEVELVTYRGRPGALGDVPTQAVRALFQPTIELPDALRDLGVWATLQDEGPLLIMPMRIDVH